MKNVRGNRFFLVSTLTSILLSPSCTTLFRMRTQPIPVTSSRALATVSVNGKPQGATPVEISLARRKRGQVIRIESPGYNPVEIQVGRDATAPDFLADALLGAAVGGLVAFAQASSNDDDNFWTELAIDAPVGAALRLLLDLVPGKGHTLTPRDLIVTMTKNDGKPRVDTMVVDADEFRNVKWIRVRID
jgi:hypothetical protein